MEKWKIIVIVIACILFLIINVGLVLICKHMCDITFIRKEEPSKEFNNNIDKNPNYEGHVEKIIQFRKDMENLHLEDIYITSYDGLKLHANLYPSKNPSNKYIIFIHGYRGNRYQDYYVANNFTHDDYNVLLIDQRSHGESEGKYISFGEKEAPDITQWEQYLHQRFGEEITLFVHGLSMGAGTALQASNLLKNTQGIIADCGLTSAAGIAYYSGHKVFKFISPLVMLYLVIVTRVYCKYWMWHRSAVKSLKHTDIPVLFIHGKKDKFVPTWMSEKNYKACRSEKEILLLDDTVHAVNHLKNKEVYEEKVNAFLNKYSK